MPYAAKWEQQKKKRKRTRKKKKKKKNFIKKSPLTYHAIFEKL
jgi:hypothetical protein